MQLDVAEPAFAQRSEASAQRSPQWFRPVLAAVVLGGLAARLAFVSWVTLPPNGLTDAHFYRTAATNLANGRGYVTPSLTHTNQLVSTAAHPPLFPGLLSVFDLLGMESVTAQRLALAVVSCLAPLFVGLLGRRVAGPLVGIVAAAIAAFNPVWIQPVGALMSESIYLVVVPLLLLLALRCLEKPTIARYVAVGVTAGCAVLTRPDAIGFVFFLGVPLLVLISVPWQTRGILGVALLAGVLLMLGPWLVRNEVQVGGAVLSDQEGVTLAGSYCPNTFNPAVPSYGSFDGLCTLVGGSNVLLRMKPPNGAHQWTELAIDKELTHVSEQFAMDHLSALPRVVVAREASTWGLGNHWFQLYLAVTEGRNETYEQAGWIFYWVMVPFVVIGSVVLVRRTWRTFVILVAPFALVVVNAAIFYGSTRVRIAAEPSLAVLAATGVLATANRIVRLLRCGSLTTRPGGAARLSAGTSSRLDRFAIAHLGPLRGDGASASQRCTFGGKAVTNPGWLATEVLGRHEALHRGQCSGGRTMTPRWGFVLTVADRR